MPIEIPTDLKDATESPKSHFLAPGEPALIRSPSSRLAAAIRRLPESLILVRIARASAVALVLLTCTFFLLSSFTFSWLNIVQNENVSWIPVLVRSYAWMYWLVLSLNTITVVPAFRRRRSRWCTEAVLLALAAIGLLLTRVYRLYDLPLSFNNVAWSVLLTLPLAGLGIHDFRLFTNPQMWRRPLVRRTLPLPAAFACGGLLAAWYFVIALLRYHGVAERILPFVPLLIVSFFLHGFLFAGLAILFSLLEQATRRENTRLGFFASLAAIWVFASLLLRHLVTPALAFNNRYADLWSWTYPLAFVVLLAGWQVRSAAIREEKIPGRVEALLWGLLPEGPGWTVAAGALALLSVFIIPYTIEQVDWNFLFQRLSSVVVWVIMFCVTWRVFARPAGNRYPWGRNLVWLLAAAACCLALVQSNHWWRRYGLKSIAHASAAYSGMDTSFQVAQIIFRPLVHDSDRTALFPYLRSNALIGDPIHPPALRLVESLTPAAGPRPDIYLIVVDTLRRDYLSPYNPRVNFTPRIASFAQESFVFRHAYTNYGGTALSEPAIWAGMMMPSKHYVQPFAEMDALEQLVAADKYQRVITPDQILRRLLIPSPHDIPLNVRGTRYFGLDLRDAVREINHLPDAPGPRFVYTQPQNLHPLTLNHLAESGAKVQGRYPGFYPRYAEEVSKVDAAFGDLIASLKAKGKFNNSIVILTSDHGDWLGEYGRWGHGQSLLSPIIEVPLLIHLPPNLARTMYSNTGQEVFLTDITPSLYYLLGHRALRKGEFYGRPLFTETAREQADYPRPYHFFMSSYSAVFAVLEDSTRSFYVADAVDDNQSLFDLNDDWYGLDNLIAPESQHKFEHLTRGFIGRLNTLYGYSPAGR